MRRSPIKRRRQKQRSRAEVDAHAAWSYCVPFGHDPHHVVLEQVCRQRARDLGVEEWVVAYDLRNRMILPRERHLNHHSRSLPLVLEELPRDVFSFVEEFGFEPWLERHYKRRGEAQ